MPEKGGLVTVYTNIFPFQTPKQNGFWNKLT